jgi:hypothetical protein
MSRRKSLLYQKLAVYISMVLLALPVILINSSPAIFAEGFRQQEAGHPGGDTAAISPTLEPAATWNLYLPLVVHSPAAPIPADCNPTGGSGGLAPGAYDTTVAGLRATVVVGKGYNPQQPTFLTFTIHGDGGQIDSYRKPGNPLNQVVNEHGWILVAPQAPNGKSWWRDWVGDHNEKLAAVFDSMFANYNVCRDIIFGTSGSGGSEYWTSQFFPSKGGDYPTHTLVACGGNDGHSSATRNQILALGKNPVVVARSSFYYVYGSTDSLVPLIEQSIDLYTKAGFNVSVEKITGAGHCNDWKDQGFTTWHEHAAAHWEQLAEQLSKN